jgi:hypothetical protein
MTLAELKMFSNPKKFIVIALLPVAAGLFWLGVSFGLEEVSLPYVRQIDELRLTDPDQIKLEIPDDAGVSANLSEGQLLEVQTCRLDGEQFCSALILGVLRNDPANGRLWLEYARQLAQEKGLNEEAVSALRKSYQLSAREGWITQIRTKFALSVWLELPADVKDLASEEIRSTMTDYEFIKFLADVYVTNPIARNALKQVMQKATPEGQNSFLGLVAQKSGS